MSVALQTTYSDSPAASLPGTLGAGPKFKVPGKNVDTASIPFGTAVAFKPTPTTDLDCYLPAASSDKIKGILYRSDSYARSWTDDTGAHGELDSTGVMQNVLMDLLADGMIYVTCEDGCAVGDRLWTRYTTAGTGKGSLRATDAGGSTSIDLTKQGVWMSAASALGLAWLKVSLFVKP